MFGSDWPLQATVDTPAPAMSHFNHFHCSLYAHTHFRSAAPEILSSLGHQGQLQVEFDISRGVAMTTSPVRTNKKRTNN